MTQFDNLPALATNPKIILFTDWDGTVTLQDSNDYLTDTHGMGYEARRVINEQILANTKSFRDGFREMLQSVNLTFDQCIEFLLKDVQLDPGFRDFYIWAREHNVPIVVLSGGMRPIIEALLVQLVGKEAIKETQIVCNDVKIHPDGKWEIVYHDDSSFGHDKSMEIKPYAALPAEERPIMFYAGDGVSDFSAARETDLLFAKQGKDLITYCNTEGVPYKEFQTYSDIHKTIQDVYEGKVTLRELQQY